MLNLYLLFSYYFFSFCTETKKKRSNQKKKKYKEAGVLAKICLLLQPGKASGVLFKKVI